MSVGEAACVSVHGVIGLDQTPNLVVFGKSAANRCKEILNTKSKNKDIKKYIIPKL